MQFLNMTNGIYIAFNLPEVGIFIVLAVISLGGVLAVRHLGSNIETLSLKRIRRFLGLILTLSIGLTVLLLLGYEQAPNKVFGACALTMAALFVCYLTTLYLLSRPAVKAWFQGLPVTE